MENELTPITSKAELLEYISSDGNATAEQLWEVTRGFNVVVERCKAGNYTPPRDLMRVLSYLRLAEMSCDDLQEIEEN